MPITKSQIAEFAAEIEANSTRREEEAAAHEAARFEWEATSAGRTPEQHRAHLDEIAAATKKARKDAAFAAEVQAELDANDPDKALAAIMARR